MNLILTSHLLSVQLRLELADEKVQHKEARSELAVEKAKQAEQITKEVDKRTKYCVEVVTKLKDYFSHVAKEGFDQCVADMYKLQIEPGVTADDKPR